MCLNLVLNLTRCRFFDQLFKDSMAKALLIFFITTLLAMQFCCAMSLSMTPTNHDNKLCDLIKSMFLGTDNRVSAAKVKIYKEKLKIRASEMKTIIENYESKFNKKNDFLVQKSIQENQLLRNYRLLFIELEKLLTLKNKIGIRRHAARILELDFAIKVAGDPPPANQFAEWSKYIVKPHFIYKDNPYEGEAVNLYNIKEKRLYTINELASMKEDKQDLSLLNPEPKSTFWKDTNIQEVDIEQNFMGGSELYKNVDIVMPTNFADFESVSKIESKLYINISHTFFSNKTNTVQTRGFRLKIGSEMHSEVTAASLMSAIGYHSDISKYARDFEMKLPSNMSIKELKAQWYKYFKNYDFEKYVKEIKKGSAGNLIVVFHEVLIETRPKEIVRVGPWAFGELGHRSLREVRAMYLFHVWVGNLYVSESKSNILVLKKNKKGNDELYHYMHDVGFAFGRYFREKAQEFPWKIVKRNDHEIVKFDYYNFQPNSGFDHVTYADARWMIRKIAKLSRVQITKAVELGGWPSAVSLLLTEKLISRRNDLIENFELGEEISELPYDKHISSKGQALKNGQLQNISFEGYTQTFGGEVEELMTPILSDIEKIAIKAAVGATSKINTFEVNSSDLGFDTGLIGKVNFDVDREIIANPNPTGENDNYLVEDKLTLKYGIGAGYIVRGVVSYVKRYKMIYPVKTYEEGMYKNNFIFNALLPISIRTKKLPDNYVITLEDGVIGEGEVLFSPTTGGISIGFGKSMGVMNRTIVSKKNDSYSVMQDKSVFDGALANLYVEFLILRFPVMKRKSETGILNRNIYHVELNTNNEQKRKIQIKALDDLIKYNDLTGVESVARLTTIEDNYVYSKNEFRFFFFRKENSKRVDTLERVRYISPIEKTVEKIYQVDVEKQSRWSFFGNGEVKTRSFRFSGEVQDDDSIIDPILDIKLNISDLNTTTEELAEHYIKNINKMALSKDFIQFTPELHTRNDLWGHNRIHLRFIYNKFAMSKLIYNSSENYYKLMAKYSNRDAKFWKSRRTRKDLPRKIIKLKKKYQRFVRSMARAAKAVTDKKRYTIVVEAVTEMIYSEGHGFSTLLMQRLHSVIGTKNYYMEGMISMPEGSKVRYPNSKPIYNILNPELMRGRKYIEFSFNKVVDTWELFH